jgi:UDP-galactopyranose mutase
MAQYDLLIVGSGLYGSVFAYIMRQSGYRCLVIDRRAHTGGNIYCERKEDIDVHTYGAHIFHTNDQDTWEFVNSFVPFNRFTNSPMAVYKGKMYNLPFNMNTFYQLWGISNPQEVKQKIAEQVKEAGITKPTNLEEQAISLVGTDIYEVLIKGYTEKQWGRSCRELPTFIIKRLPVRFTFDNNYFNDKYQGIPEGGYNRLTEGLLGDTPIQLKMDYLANREYFNSLEHYILYTGPIDAFYNYKYGTLDYRSLGFQEQYLPIDNYQGVAVVNYTEVEVPFTRIVEHKHFTFGNQAGTIITKEYPMQWEKNLEPYYPINDEVNNKLFARYQALAAHESNVLFGGRLADYKYYDMHQVIASARVRANQFIQTKLKQPI